MPVQLNLKFSRGHTGKRETADPVWLRCVMRARAVKVMNIKILCVGKCKEKYFTDALKEYTKRLSRYCRAELIEVPDEPAPETLSKAQELQVKEREGERLLQKIRQDDYVIALAIEGRKFDSPGFSRMLEQKMTEGKSSIVFVIGGSLGLSDSVLSRSNEQISFSDMTFPHQLMRVILAEQVYRGFRIMRGEPYHK